MDRPACFSHGPLLDPPLGDERSVARMHPDDDDHNALVVGTGMASLGRVRSLRGPGRRPSGAGSVAAPGAAAAGPQGADGAIAGASDPESADAATSAGYGVGAGC